MCKYKNKWLNILIDKRFYYFCKPIFSEMIIRKIFPVEGLGCAACAARVERVLREHKGVREANVNFASLKARVDYDDSLCSPQSLAKAVSDAGYSLITDKEEKQEQTNGKSEQTNCLLAIILTIPTILLCMVWPDLDGAPFFMWILSTPVVFRCGKGFFQRAWIQARHRSCNMDTLVALSTAIAYLFSLANLFFPAFWASLGLVPHVWFEAAAGVVTFVLIGRYLESRAKTRMSSAIKNLMALTPDHVTRLTPDGQPDEIPLDSVLVGDILLLRPGDKIPVDGKVISGCSAVDESSLTGESLPINKQTGSDLFAGTLNLSGSLQMKSTSVGSDTLLAHIIYMVESAQGSKAPVQRLADKVAAVFVPCVLALSALTFLSWLLIGGTSLLGHALMAAVSVLVIACPCALGLATPTALTVGIGRAAKKGILIRDASSLEMAASVNAVVFDKTGTITEGRPSVAESLWRNGSDESLLLASLESLSHHPLGLAITSFYGSGNKQVESFSEIAGVGLKGIIDGKAYYACSLAQAEKIGLDIDRHLMLFSQESKAKGMALVCLTDDSKVLGIVALSDKIRPSAPDTIKALSQKGLDVYMLTGDNPGSAISIALNVGIDPGKCVSEVLPDKKADFIKKLQASGLHVAMIGDGINDSAALALSDVSIAMASGSDIAKDVAGITIMSSDLHRVEQAFLLSQSTLKRIKQNLFWAFFYNVLAIPIAAGVLFPLCGLMLNPMIAGAAMAMSSLCVVGNSLRR